MRPVIGIIGSSSAAPEVEKLAEEAGKLILDGGFNLICGGMGGVMAAACRGARSSAQHGGGVAIGVLPGEDVRAANAYCDVAIATGIGCARNVVIIRSADGLLAISGGSGTLSEIALAWQLGKPVVALKPSGGWSARLAGLKLDDRRSDCIICANSPAEAVAILEKAIQDRAMGPGL